MSYRGYDLLLFVTILALAALGTVMIYSSSAFLASTMPAFGSAFFFLRRHLLALVLGLVIMTLAMRLDYHRWRRFTYPLLFLSVVLLIAVLTVGKEVRGVRRWLAIGPISFQPSEVARFAFVLYLARVADGRQERMRRPAGLIPPLVVMGLLSALIIMQPNFGTAGAILLIGFFLLFLKGVKLPHLLALLLVGLGLFLLFTRCFPYAKGRLLSYLSALRGEGGYQLRQSLLGIGSGGVTGVGLGRGRGKLLFLPQPHTDFAFATIAEELGFLGGLGLLFLFLVVFVRGVKIAKRAPDPFGFYVAIGMAAMVFIYAILHTGVVLGVLPTTGLPLPFVSYGRTSLLSSFLGMGILLNISLKGAEGALKKDRLYLRRRSRRFK